MLLMMPPPFHFISTGLSLACWDTQPPSPPNVRTWHLKFPPAVATALVKARQAKLLYEVTHIDGYHGKIGKNDVKIFLSISRMKRKTWGLFIHEPISHMLRTHPWSHAQMTSAVKRKESYPFIPRPKEGRSCQFGTDKGLEVQKTRLTSSVNGPLASTLAPD